MSELPLNLNLKIDRNQLRKRDDSQDNAGIANSTMSPVETALLGIASDVLKRSGISLDDNFFESGGNSLRVMEFFTRIRAAFDCDVTLLDIYAYPTIRQLSYRLSTAKQKQLWEVQYRNTT
jgi:acyl carrier protein